MTEIKISTELQLAMEIPEEEREKSLNLNTGFDELLGEWELIIRYTGQVGDIRQELGIAIEELSGGYGIVRIPQYLIGALSDYPQIDYIEKPKNLILEQMEGIRASCITRLRSPDYNLTGKDVLIACLDSGVDIYHPDFRNADGTTRIVELWDQTVPGNPPTGFTTGSVYSREDINIALFREENGERFPSFDAIGHGTAVLGVAAGNGRASGGVNAGVAPEAELLVVKVGNPDSRGFPRTTQMMQAVEYAYQRAVAMGKPIAINISYGNNYGAHSGDSMLERYLDRMADLYRMSIVTGTGNDGITGRHASGNLREGRVTEEVYVGNYLESFNLQIWKAYQDEMEITLETPDGKRIGPFSPYAQVQNYTLQREFVSVLYGEPTPYTPRQEIYVSWIPKDNYITAGIWKLHMEPRRIIDGSYDMWLPVAGSTTAEVAFVRPALSKTLVIPSTARNVLSVAAYNSQNDTYAAFSGRGTQPSFTTYPSFFSSGYKPDIAAPGVNINTSAVGGGYRVVSGTSFAAPFVTGAAALLLQYGIVDGRDPYLYGEKLRASLVRGARQLPFQISVPDFLAGWGGLCVADSLPKG